MVVLFAASLTSGFDVQARDSAAAARFEFRPLSRADDKAAYMAQRPQVSDRATALHDQRMRLPDITNGRKGSRKALPVTRGQELGMRFRPDERDPVQGSAAAGRFDGGVPTQAESDAAFRPIARRSRPSYEELEAQRRSVPPQPMPGGYPMLPGGAPPPPVGLPWMPW